MLTQHDAFIHSEQTLSDVLRHRRQKLAERISFPVVLWSGKSSPKNFPANPYPFRASSHFLYFAGLPLQNAAIRLESGQLQLFLDNPPESSILWHGLTPSRDEIAAQIGADEAHPMVRLQSYAEGAATIAVQDPMTRQQQAQLLKRAIALSHQPEGLDAE